MRARWDKVIADEEHGHNSPGGERSSSLESSPALLASHPDTADMLEFL